MISSIPNVDTQAISKFEYINDYANFWNINTICEKNIQKYTFII